MEHSTPLQTAIAQDVERNGGGQSSVSSVVEACALTRAFASIQVVTGATGSLGSFLLEQLSNLPSDIVEKVVCLVRADNDLKGRLRVEKVVDRRGAELHGDTVTVYSAELSAPQLGLTGEVYAELAEKVDVIIHASRRPRRARKSHLIASRPLGPYTSPVVWSPLRAVSCTDRTIRNTFLSDLGTRNLLDLLAAASPASRLYFCSSLASVLAKPYVARLYH
jgi:hypothetical protein